MSSAATGSVCGKVGKASGSAVTSGMDAAGLGREASLCGSIGSTERSANAFLSVAYLEFGGFCRHVVVSRMTPTNTSKYQASHRAGQSLCFQKVSPIVLGPLMAGCYKK